MVVGEGFRFGYKAAGNTKMLQELGQAHGMDVSVVSLVASGCIWDSGTQGRRLEPKSAGHHINENTGKSVQVEPWWPRLNWCCEAVAWLCRLQCLNV